MSYERGNVDTDTGRKPWGDGGRDQGDASIKPRKLKTAADHQKPEERKAE